MTDMDSASPQPRIIAAAFYVTLVLGVLALVVIPWNPGGLIQGPLYLIAAIGIRRKRAWSAYGLALLTLVTTAVPILELSRQTIPMSFLATAVLFGLGIALVLLFAGRAIERCYGRHGLAWPWIAGSACVGVFFALFSVYQTPTGSMENTLLVGDRVAVLKTHGRPPVRGELVVHVYPVNRRDVFIKRVVAIPGDRVQLRNKQLYVNGAAVSEPYAEHKTSYTDPYRDNFPTDPTVPLYPQGREMLAKNVVNGEVVVPAGRYFVLGDNRDSSLDSRYWGFIEAADIIGKPEVVYYSVKPNVTELGENRLPLLNVRWGRIFHVVG